MAVTFSPSSSNPDVDSRWNQLAGYNDKNWIVVTNDGATKYLTSITFYMAMLAYGSRVKYGSYNYYGIGGSASLTATMGGKSGTTNITQTIGSYDYDAEAGAAIYYAPNSMKSDTYKVTITFANPPEITANATSYIKFTFTPAQADTSKTYSGNYCYNVVCWEKSWGLTGTYNDGQYIVTYNGNGNTGGSTSSQTFTLGVAGTVAANGFSKTGYNFVKWNTKSDGSGTSYNASTSYTDLSGASAGGTVTLYAQWSAASYTVTLDRQSGSGGSSSTTATYASAMPSINVPSRTGYTFQGYYTSTDGGGTKYYNADGTSAKAWDIASATTLYAYWVPKSYTVTFNGNGGGTPSPTSKSVTYASTYGTLATCSRTGYTFAGWYTATSGGTQITSSSTVSITADQTLYAHWNINSYTLSYDKNGGSSTPSSVTKDYNTTVSLASAIARDTVTNATYTVTYSANGYGTAPSASTTYNKTYYTFSKWAAGSTGGTQYSAGASYTITGDIKMYALWSSLTSTAAITLSTISDPNNQHFFDGWYDKASGGNKIGDAGASYTPTKNITLYAHWTDNNITVQYNANGGSGTINSVTKLYNETITLDSGANFTRSGYKLIGWNTAADDSGTKYKLGKTGYAVTQAVTMYAVWYQNFSWTSNDSTNVTANKPISNATASQWNKLQDNIKKYVDSSYTKTTKSAGDKVVASEVKAVAQKLAVSTAEQNKIVQNQVIPASVFNALTTQINSKAEYLGAS